MLCRCQHCGKQFEAKRSTARFCSEACKKASQRKGNARIRLTPQQRQAGSSFVAWLVTTVKRSGSLAVLPAPTNQAGWNDLYRLYAKSQCFNYSLPEGESVHLSHYCPASNRGALTASNIGVWPAAVNLQHGDKGMPYGVQIPLDTFRKGSVEGMTTGHIRNAILKRHGDNLSKLKTLRGTDLKSLPLTPVTQAIKQLIRLTGRSFDSLISLSRKALNELFEQYDIDPALDAILTRLPLDRTDSTPADQQTLKELAMTVTKRPLSDFTDMTKTEIIQLLKRHNVTKGMVKTVPLFHDTLGNVHRQEALHQLKQFATRTNPKSAQAVADLKQFADLADRATTDTFNAWLECGSLAITGRADTALMKLKRLIAQRDIEPAAPSNYVDADPDSCLQLDDGTIIFEVIDGRPSSDLTSDQLYSWYATSRHYDRRSSVTGAAIRQLYDEDLSNALQAA